MTCSADEPSPDGADPRGGKTGRVGGPAGIRVNDASGVQMCGRIALATSRNAASHRRRRTTSTPVRSAVAANLETERRRLCRASRRRHRSARLGLLLGSSAVWRGLFAAEIAASAAAAKTDHRPGAAAAGRRHRRSNRLPRRAAVTPTVANHSPAAVASDVLQLLAEARFFS